MQSAAGVYVPELQKKRPMSYHRINVQLPEAVSGLISESVLADYGKLATGGDFSPSSKGIKAQLAGLTPGCLFDAPVGDLAMAHACLAGLWLLHGYLDESHEISQALKTSEGSFWHGVMHRIERDFWNSKYWGLRRRWGCGGCGGCDC